MRRFVAALVLMGTVSLSVLVPSASAQWIPGPYPVGPFGAPGPVMESFGVTGGVPYSSTQFFGPGGIQCQYGGYVLPGALGTGTPQVSPFFNASAYGPFGPGPCTPPPALLAGAATGLGTSCATLNPNTTLANLVALGLGTSTTTAAGVTLFTLTCTGQTFTLATGTNLATATLASLPGFTGLGGVLGLAGLPGVGLPGLSGLAGLGSLGLLGGTVTGTGGCPAGLTGVSVGSVTICR